MSVRPAVDRTSFIGVSVPADVRACVKMLNSPNTDSVMVGAILQVANLHVIGSNSVEGEFEKCLQKYGEDALKMYPGILQIVRSAVRIPQYSLGSKDFANDLTSLNIPKKFHEQFNKIVFGPERGRIDESCLNEKPRYPTLEQFRWRVDVAISTSRLSRVLEPSILMMMKTTTGEAKCFEVSKEKFHELRYAVAYVLKQMQQIEKRSVLQIKS